MSGRFPSDFLWGVASAGHQNEGGNTGSDTWFLEHTTPTIFQEPSGVACNAWQRWPADLDLVAGMGLNACRFSTEWARIEPEPGHFDSAALDHYEQVVDGCLERGLKPIVTLCHFTAPHWFAMRGAWLSDDAADLFARFTEQVIGRFGDRVGAIVTLNEPNLARLLSWMDLPPQVVLGQRAMLEAASAACGVPRYRAGNIVLPEEFDAMQAGMTSGHVAARTAVKALYPELPVGLSIAITDDHAAEGGEAVRDRKRAEVYDHWLEVAREDDFIGVQNYERIVYGPEGPLPPEPGATVNGMGTAIEPRSLAGAVRYSHEISGRPVLVTEHGVSTPDDSIRAGFIEPSLDGLAEVIGDGVPVLGYCHWTLMDNFEWVFGYEPKLGLHSVDRNTLERIAKPSASVFANYVKVRG